MMEAIPKAVEELRHNENALRKQKAELEYELRALQTRLDGVNASLQKNCSDQSDLLDICASRGLDIPPRKAAEEVHICRNCKKAVRKESDHIHDGAYGEMYQCRRYGY